MGNLLTPLGANDTPWWYNPNTFSTGFANPTFTFGSGTFGTGNFAANQTLGLISGIMNGGGGFGLNALANQGTVLVGGLQALPQPINGVPNFF